MRRTIFLYTSLLLFMASTHAQEGAYRYDDATQLWRLTSNAAALGIDSLHNRGYALFNGEHHSGDYTRIQEGNQTNQLRFKSERYQTIGKYLYGYGRFDFDLGRTKERSWADVMRPYNANPYFSGSAIKGKYDFQDFDFTAAIGTTAFNGWRFGMRLDYKAGDLSRLRDPRPRIQLLDYKVTPAVAYTAGMHTVALSGSYHRRKEKFTGVKNEQKNATIKYYFMSGLENVDGKTNGYESFWREWVDHRFGGELSYAFHSQTQHSLLSLSIERGEEYAYEQYKYEPGRYVDYQYGIALRNRFYEGNTIHQLDISMNIDQAYADEYRQKLIATQDASTGLTSYSYERLLTYKKRYQVNVFNADILYRAHFCKGREEQAYAGFHVALDDSKNKYLLPTSTFSHGGTTIMAEGGGAITKRLWVEASAGGYVAQSPELDLADPTTDYAQQVLLPDLSYYAANYWRGHLQLTYQFPLKIKGTDTRWFVRAYGDYIKTNNSLNSKTIGLSIGLFN